MKVLNNLDLWGKLSLSASSNNAQRTEDFALVISTEQASADSNIVDFTLAISTVVRFFSPNIAGGYNVSDRTIKEEIDDNAKSIKTLRNEFDTMMGDETSITGVVDTFNEIKLFLDDYSNSDLKDILDAFVAKNSANTVGENFLLEMENSMLLSPRALSLRSGDYAGPDVSENPEIHLMKGLTQYNLRINDSNYFELGDGGTKPIFRGDYSGLRLTTAIFEDSEDDYPFTIDVHQTFGHHSLKITDGTYVVRLSSGITISEGNNNIYFALDSIYHPNIDAGSGHVDIKVPNLGNNGLKIKGDEIALGTSSDTPLLIMGTKGARLPYIYVNNTEENASIELRVGTSTTFGIQTSDRDNPTSASMKFRLADNALQLLPAYKNGSYSFQIARELSSGEYERGTTLGFSHIAIGSGIISKLHSYKGTDHDGLIIGTTAKTATVGGMTYHTPHIELRAYHTGRSTGYIAIGTDTLIEAITVGEELTIRDFVLNSSNGTSRLDSNNNTLNVNGNPVLTSDNVRTIYTFATTTYTVNHSYGPYPKVTVYELGSGGEYNIVYANVSNKDNSDGTYKLTVGVAQAGSYVLNVGY